MSSLVIFTYGEFPEPAIYSHTAYERVVVLFMLCDEDAPEESESFHPWYVIQGKDVVGPVYAQVSVDREWKSASIAEVAPALAEHGIVALTAWEEMFEVDRSGDVYLYSYTVEGSGILAREATEWVDADIKRHCELYEPQGTIVTIFAIAPVVERFTGSDGWRSAVLVKEGPGYQIWLSITLSRAKPDD